MTTLRKLKIAYDNGLRRFLSKYCSASEMFVCVFAHWKKCQENIYLVSDQFSNNLYAAYIIPRSLACSIWTWRSSTLDNRILF